MNPVIAMLIGVVVMMVLIICTRMHAFPSLIISAILIAVLSGNYLLAGTGNEGGNLLSVAINTVTGGFGGTMTSIGIVIGFGCIMGIFLEKSGAAKRMAITILKLVGVKRADVVLGLTGFVVSIPVFCDSGFVILSSLAKEFSRLTKKSMVGLGGILGMGLYITHFMVPPTPGPLAVVSTFQNEGINIDLGMFIIAGLLLSIPLFIFSVFLFRQFYKTIDNALLEAAYIDGAGDLRVYWSIILPLSKSAIATVAIIGFIGNWNSYMWPKVVATKESLRTVQTGLRMLMQSDFGDDWGSIMAAATLITMPMILFFVCLQRYFVQGITKVGLK